jgi:phage antirepressor YoqD-like protein
MSSLEIADLTGKRHTHIIRDIENMFNELEIGETTFGSTYKDASNRNSKCYNLNKELTETLITGYSIKLRHAVIVRLRQLEEDKAQLPTDPKEQALLLSHALIDAHKQIEEQKPAVEFASQMAANKGSIKVGDFAKILFDKNNLVIGQNRLFKWFRMNKYLQADNKPFQRFVDQGLFQVVSGVIDGTTRIWSTTKITGKGMVYFTSKLIESKDFKPVNKLQIEAK